MGGGGPSSEQIQADRETNQKQIEAMERQREASLQAANIQAMAGLQAAQIGAQAQMAASKNAAIGGIISSAMAAHTTTEEIKQMLPSEVQAEFQRSYEMAAKWQKTLDMRTAGYQNVAIEYELSGKNFRPLFRDSQYNALEMARLTQKDIQTSARVFGIQSDKNPGGVPISQAYWMKLNSMKDPREMLTVDPKVAAQRKAEFAAWEQQMRANGMGLAVDIYKNPQLGGSSILTMKGKEPLLDPALAPLVTSMMKDQPVPQMNMGALNPYPYGSVYTAPMPGTDQVNLPFGTSVAVPGNKDMGIQIVKSGGVKRDANGRIIALDPQAPGLQGMLSQDELKALSPLINAQASMSQFQNAMAQGQPQGGGTDWDAVVAALTKGEQNPYTDEIKKYQQMGLIDKYGMVNAGMLLSMVPESLRDAPEFNMFKELTPEQQRALQDQYDHLSSVQMVDPKYITERQVAPGVVRRQKINPDGSIAYSSMEGEMYDAMGNPVWVSIGGNRLQDYYDRLSMIDGMGPTFPTMRAPVTNEELSGRFEPGFWGENTLAKPRASAGQGTTASQKATATGAPAPLQFAAASMQQGGMASSSSAASGDSSGGSGAEQKPATVSSLGSGLVNKTSQPAGYEGAPLAAGGE